jgi:site-specific DNA-methyltransferase (adenine-specific)
MSTTQAGFSVRGHNPDVLDCIANLSNDEVFTPPAFANRMLDRVAVAWAESHDGEDIWTNPAVTFLDPFTKSGVFLREVTRRLAEGLEGKIPNLEKRIDHILTNQVFGVAITHLTSLLARRSVYCSKWANGEHSVARSFTTDEGHVWFRRMEHTWEGGTEWVVTADEGGNNVRRFTNGRCKFCGVGQQALDRGDALETHAYAFIHADNVRALLTTAFGEDMQFDVVIGNPPYQLETVGNNRAIPIYQKFVEAAVQLEPKLIAMVTPSRWFAGGLGLDEFRARMLSDARLKVLVDFPNASDVFPGVEIKGGVSYFVWDRDHDGEAQTQTVRDGAVVASASRRLDEFDVLVRDPRALPILKKVMAHGEPSFATLVSPLKPFGLVSNFPGYSRERKSSKSLSYYTVLNNKRFAGFVEPSQVPMNLAGSVAPKLLLPKAGSDGGKNESDLVIGKPWKVGGNSICSGTFMYVPGTSAAEVESMDTYVRTRFARFLISLRKITQDTKADTYSWLPVQVWDRRWTDGELYRKYDLGTQEVAFIERLVRPMDLDAGEDA